MRGEQSLYARRKAEGLCGACGKVETGGELCPGCKEKSREKAAAKRAAKKSSGHCYGSGCKNVPESGTWCNDCKARNKSGRTQRIARKKSAGVCVQAGCQNEAKEGCVLCQACINKRSAVSCERYRQHKLAGLCRFCNQEPAEPGSSLCEYHKERYKEYRLSVKLDAMEAYGGAFCCVCNSPDIEVLEIDHIEGGNQHRNSLNMEGGGYTFYLWLKRNGYPDGYRVLCPTCNKKAHMSLLSAKTSK